MDKYKLNYVIVTSDDNHCFLESKDGLEESINDILGAYDKEEIKVFKLGKEVKLEQLKEGK